MSVILKDFTTLPLPSAIALSCCRQIPSSSFNPVSLFNFPTRSYSPALKLLQLGALMKKTPSPRWKRGSWKINQSHRYETAIKSVSEQKKIRNTTCIEKFCPVPPVLRWESSLSSKKSSNSIRDEGSVRNPISIPMKIPYHWWPSSWFGLASGSSRWKCSDNHWRVLFF